MKTKFGFTLAEVLITLGIIGVVAALTLPSLVTNYQKQVTVNKLKKDINEIVENLDDDKIRYLYSFLNAIK